MLQVDSDRFQSRQTTLTWSAQRVTIFLLYSRYTHELREAAHMQTTSRDRVFFTTKFISFDTNERGLKKKFTDLGVEVIHRRTHTYLQLLYHLK